MNALNELEALKPDVQRRLEELNRKNRSQVNIWGQALEDGSFDDSFVWPPVKKKIENNKTSQVLWPLTMTRKVAFLQTDKDDYYK